MRISTEYIAGLFDGEGCIIARKVHNKPHYYISIQITNSFKPILEKLLKKFGGTLRQNGNKPPKLPCYTWTLYSTEAKCFLEGLIPHLTVKKRQAKLAVELQKGIDHRNTNGQRLYSRWNPLPNKLIRRREYLAQEIKKEKYRAY